MEKIMILNGSPRAVRSNSRRYAEIFSKKSKCKTEYFNILKTNHHNLCSKMAEFRDVLLVFPLYADGIPVTLLDFLKTLELNSPKRKPVVSGLINCGFLEHGQNDTAVCMIRLFCEKNGYRFGSGLQIGSGGAILDSPFKILVKGKIKKLASSICNSRYRALHTTMPIPAKVFVKAAEKYWVNYGAKNGVTKEEMRTMKIEE